MAVDLDVTVVGAAGHGIAWLKDVNGEQVSKTAAKETISELKRFRTGTYATEVARKR